MTSQQNFDTVGVVLAGGESRRMGTTDKCLLPLAGVPLLEHVIARAQPQVVRLLLSANGDPARFAQYPLPIVTDFSPDQGGPLAGIISAMDFTSKRQPQPKWLATFPCDAPLAPRQWVAQLRREAMDQQLSVIVAADPGQIHYTFALWSLDCLTTLKTQYAEGERALHKIVRQLNGRASVCCDSPRPFTNLNTRDELEQLNASDISQWLR